jgi:enterobactin synthetase component D
MVLPIGPRRAPVWPDGLVGSIAHSGNMAIAAVGRGARWAGLGIDLEQSGNAARTADFVPRIVTPPEIASLAPSFAAPLATLLVFSAKEAIYKAVAARAGRIGFADARCTGIHGDRLRFATSDLLRPVTGHALEVQFAVADAHIFTLCAVAAG